MANNKKEKLKLRKEVVIILSVLAVILLVVVAYNIGEALKPEEEKVDINISDLGLENVGATVENNADKVQATVEVQLLDTAVETGTKFKVTAIVTPINTEQALVWSSSNTGVFEVDGNGIVSVKGVGTAVLTATVGNVSDAVVIEGIAKVTDGSSNNLPIYNVSMNTTGSNGGSSNSGNTGSSNSGSSSSSNGSTSSGNSGSVSGGNTSTGGLSNGGSTVGGSNSGSTNNSGSAGNSGGSTNNSGSAGNSGGSTNNGGSASNSGGITNNGGSANNSGGSTNNSGSVSNSGGSTNSGGSASNSGGSTNNSGSASNSGGSTNNSGSTSGGSNSSGNGSSSGSTGSTGSSSPSGSSGSSGNTDDKGLDSTEIGSQLPSMGFDHLVTNVYVCQEGEKYYGEIITQPNVTIIYVMQRGETFDAKIQSVLATLLPTEHSQVWTNYITSASDRTFTVEDRMVRIVVPSNGGHSQIVIYN